MSNIVLEPESTDKTQRNTKTWLVVSQVISVIGLVLPSLLGIIGLLTYIVFPSEDFSGVTIWQVLILAGVLLIGPAVTILCAAFAWQAYNNGLYRRASIVTGIPLVFFVLVQFVLPVVLMFIAVVFGGYRG